MYTVDDMLGGVMLFKEMLMGFQKLLLLPKFGVRLIGIHPRRLLHVVCFTALLCADNFPAVLVLFFFANLSNVTLECSRRPYHGVLPHMGTATNSHTV